MTRTKSGARLHRERLYTHTKTGPTMDGDRWDDNGDRLKRGRVKSASNKMSEKAAKRKPFLTVGGA